MNRGLSYRSSGSITRVLIIVLAILLMSATAVAAERLFGSSLSNCDGYSVQAAEIEQWLKTRQQNERSGKKGVAEINETGCLACHSKAGRLIRMVEPPANLSSDGCATAPARPPFLGYFVNRSFPRTLHGQLGCTGCHGGNSDAVKADVAHQDLQDPNRTCTNCHAKIVAQHDTSLHKTLNGMEHELQLRAGHKDVSALETVWQSDCASCHTTCGDCHISLPDAVGGGLIKGHAFLRRAPMQDSCALCHGTRAGGEYLGQFEGIAPDVHFEAGMHCLDCHTNDLHGDGQLYQSRWQVKGRAQCTDCHAISTDTGISAHGDMHADVACQVCHAQPYQNCFNCHTGEEDGKYFRRVGAKKMILKVGRNTAKGYPFGVVTLRHNPVARHSFDHFGAGLLPEFDGHPNWKTAAPHNIRRQTPQNRNCVSCHEDTSLFLGPEDLLSDGPSTNQDVILPMP